ncbi:MAG: T9SS type A sorting domain-containing protein, partial [Bacteroidia bacterium]|nr:T9SS type A sorting domain-containing protein [Bacteroidia bacterium]
TAPNLISIEFPLSDNEVQNQLKMAPNPSSGLMTVDIALLGAPFIVYNVNGQAVKSGIFTEQLLDLTSLKSGIYYLKSEQKTAKIVLNRD